MNFEKLNTMTKYPEIKTYHKMGEKGRLQPELSIELDPDKTYHLSEKVDGTNTRMIFIAYKDSCDYVIGSREELFYANGDRIINHELNIVNNLLPVCDTISEIIHQNFSSGIFTIYSELYGGKLPASKQYTSTKDYAFRVFDMMVITPIEYIDLFKKQREQIAQWRDHGGQEFFNNRDRIAFCMQLGLRTVPLHRIAFGSEIPTDLKDTYEFMQSYRTTKAGINCEGGRAEGIVIRSDYRKEIVKLRFEDYERTLGIKRK